MSEESKKYKGHEDTPRINSILSLEFTQIAQKRSYHAMVDLARELEREIQKAKELAKHESIEWRKHSIFLQEEIISARAELLLLKK